MVNQQRISQKVKALGDIGPKAGFHQKKPTTFECVLGNVLVLVRVQK
jgi:hypothetical protein